MIHLVSLLKAQTRSTLIAKSLAAIRFDIAKWTNRAVMIVIYESWKAEQFLDLSYARTACSLTPAEQALRTFTCRNLSVI